MGKKEVGFKGRVEPQKAIEYLEKILEGLKSGTWYVQHGDEYVSLQPSEMINMEFSASQKKEKEKFSLELSWYSMAQDNGGSELNITTSKPEIEEEQKREEQPGQEEPAKE
jgi:amphi-Trp domain-containing protein